VATPPSSPAREIELGVPIVWAGEEIKVLHYKRPTAAQLWNFKLPLQSEGASMPMGELLAVGAKCCGLAEGAVKLLDAGDAMRLATMVGETLGSSLATGT
jgi:hypothetical protein